MAEELVMPRLSDTMERGTVARWLKSEGDAVAAGDIVAEIETDKATMDYQSDVDGVLLRILVADGETAELGAPIGLVGEQGEEVPDAGDGSAGARAGAESAAPGTAPPSDTAANATDGSSDVAGATGTATGPSGPAPTPVAEPAQEPARPKPERSANGRGGPLRVSPIARRMADEAGVDLAPLAGRGSGPDGRVVKADVERLIAEGPPAPAAPEAPAPAPAAPAPVPAPAAAAGERDVRAPSSMLRTVARRMAEAKATVPHFYLQGEIDMTRAIALRKEINAGLGETGEKVSLNDLIVKACATALVQHPQFHRSWTDEGLVYHRHANVGIAVALEDGLIVPVVQRADEKGLRQIARETRELAGRARGLKLKQHEIEGATFSVSNLGMFGIPNFQAIVNPPEPGILAVGAAVERAVVVEGEVVVRPIMGVTLSIDHRASSGADGARFLATVKRLLEGGVLLLA